jgi:H+/gluconate symporter-like permease
MGLAGILLGLVVLIWLSYRGWSVLLLAPAASLIAAAAAREPLLAHWTLTFMGGAAKFLAQFFPLFLLGALFGKLMEDSGSIEVIARFITDKLGAARAILAVTIAGAIVTFGGVSLFVALFVIVPMAQRLFMAADLPRRLVPAAVALGTMTFTMSALPGTPALQNAIPMPFFGTTPFAAPGLGLIAAAIMLGFGLWWLGRAEAAARRSGEGYGESKTIDIAAQESSARERATIASEFDPAELTHGRHVQTAPTIFVAVLPLIVVIGVNFAMSLFVLPRLDTSFLAEERWGGTSLAAVGGVWAVVVALTAALLTLIALNYRRLPSLRESMDAGANASVLPALSVASLVGFGAVIGALPAFALVRGLGARNRGWTSRLARDRSEHSGCPHGLGLWRSYHRARYLRRDIPQACVRKWNRPGTSASHCRDERRNARQSPAQWSCSHLARGVRRDPSRKLCGPFRRGDHRCTDRACSRDCTWYDLRLILIQSPPTR